MHYYQAWAPWGIRLLPQAWHLRTAACDASAEIRQMAAHVAPVYVGEWSSAMTDCAMWINGLGLQSGYNAALGINRGACARVRCPSRFNNLTAGATLAGGPDASGLCPTGERVDEGSPVGKLGADDFYALLTEYMVGAYESSAGWTFWNFDNEMSDPRWSFFAAQSRGWFPSNLSAATYAPRAPDCTSWDTMFGTLATAAAVCALSVLLALCGGLALTCRTKPCRRLRRRCGCSCADSCAGGSRARKRADDSVQSDRLSEGEGLPDEGAPSSSMGPIGGRSLG